MNLKIPLFKIYWDENDVKAVTESIKRGMNWAAGPNIEKFEKKLADYLKINYVITFSSGTSALHSVLLAYGIGKGDEVIVPSFTFIATTNAVLMVGANPVFADIEEERYGLDPEDVKKKITSKTKAIIPVHYGGCSAKIAELKKIAQENNILLIEDAAESFGAKENNKLVGTFGDSAMFSLCQTKVFTTGEGGFIATNSKELYEKLKLLRSHGRAESGDYFTSGEFMDYVYLGYNFRMPDIIAGLGISQLEKVDKLISLRRSHAEYMTKILSDIEEIIIPKIPSSVFHVFQEYYIRIKKGEEDRNNLKKFLVEKGVGTRISFPPVHKTKFYKELGYSDILENTEKISSSALTLPLYPSLIKEEMDYIAKQIKEYYQKYGK
jgi:perosamine synthetase